MRSLPIILLFLFFVTSCKTDEEKQLEDIGRQWIRKRQSADAQTFFIEPTPGVIGLQPELFQSIAYSTANEKNVKAQQTSTTEYTLTLGYNTKKHKSSADCAVTIFLSRNSATGVFTVKSWNKCLGCG